MRSISYPFKLSLSGFAPISDGVCIIVFVFLSDELLSDSDDILIRLSLAETGDHYQLFVKNLFIIRIRIHIRIHILIDLKPNCKLEAKVLF